MVIFASKIAVIKRRVCRNMQPFADSINSHYVMSGNGSREPETAF